MKKLPVWADVPNPIEIKNWNRRDGEIDRQSHICKYDIHNGFPRNPMGRTGITGN